MIMGADCVPVLLYDRVKHVIAAVHAGWRGTVQNIVTETIKAMQHRFTCRPENILAAIGPSISSKNYEVDQPVYDAFSKNFHYFNKLFSPGKKSGKYQLNLWKANQLQLLSAGLKASHIELANICTFENNNHFFSARKNDSGRFATGIMLT